MSPHAEIWDSSSRSEYTAESWHTFLNWLEGHTLIPATQMREVTRVASGPLWIVHTYALDENGEPYLTPAKSIAVEPPQEFTITEPPPPLTPKEPS